MVKNAEGKELVSGRDNCHYCKEEKGKDKTAYWAVRVKRDVFVPACTTCGKKRTGGVQLPKDKHRGEYLKSEHEERVAAANALAAQRRQGGGAGTVHCTKLMMMRNPVYVPGAMAIFPNARHGSRSDGIGMPALSPKLLGPVHHGQPGLEPSVNLENFHQGNKVFPSEVDPKTKQPLLSFYKTQKSMYADQVAHRHKVEAGAAGAGGSGGGGKKKTAPLYSIWVDRQGKEHHMDYIGSRQFYCTYYERLATKTAEFERLVGMLRDGFDLQIIGYDGYDLQGQCDAASFERRYLDPTRPFGHEMALCALLCLKPEEYPWRKHAIFEM